MKKNKTSSHDTLRQLLNLLFAVTQILGGGFSQLTGIGTSIGSQSATSETPVIPATYAFSIWGIIFLASLIYAVYQALPNQRENKLFRQIGFMTAAAFFGNTVWEVVAQVISLNWPTAIIILFVLIPSLMALFRLTDYKGPISTSDKIIAYIPVSALAGWVSAATFANISSVLKQLNYYPFNLSETALSIVILISATSLATAVLVRSRGNYLYATSIVWALVAIAVANIYTMPNPIVAWTTVGLTVSIVVSTFFVRILNSKR
jgi:hypothetical protein